MDQKISHTSRRELLAAAALVGLAALAVPRMINLGRSIDLDAARGELTKDNLESSLQRKVTLNATPEFVETAKRNLWSQGFASRSNSLIPASGYLASGPFHIYIAKEADLRVEILLSEKLEKTGSPMTFTGRLERDEAGVLVLRDASLKR